MTSEDEAPILLLIDGSHVDRLNSKLGRMIDLEKLAFSLGKETREVRTVYYRDSRDPDEMMRLSRFFEWLSRHGIERRGSDAFAEPWYVRERYGSNLLALAADAMGAACEGSDLAFLAGDQKLIPLFEKLEEMDVPVTLLSSQTVPKSIAPPPPLIDLAETFIELSGNESYFMSER